MYSLDILPQSKTLRLIALLEKIHSRSFARPSTNEPPTEQRQLGARPRSPPHHHPSSTLSLIPRHYPPRRTTKCGGETAVTHTSASSSHGCGDAGRSVRSSAAAVHGPPIIVAHWCRGTVVAFASVVIGSAVHWMATNGGRFGDYCET